MCFGLYPSHECALTRTMYTSAFSHLTNAALNTALPFFPTSNEPFAVLHCVVVAMGVQINTGDVEEVDGLFHDAKASAQLLADDAEGYLH